MLLLQQLPFEIRVLISSHLTSRIEFKSFWWNVCKQFRVESDKNVVLLAYQNKYLSELLSKWYLTVLLLREYIFDFTQMGEEGYADGYYAMQLVLDNDERVNIRCRPPIGTGDYCIDDEGLLAFLYQSRFRSLRYWSNSRIDMECGKFCFTSQPIFQRGMFVNHQKRDKYGPEHLAIHKNSLLIGWLRNAFLRLSSWNGFVSTSEICQGRRGITCTLRNLDTFRTLVKP